MPELKTKFRYFAVHTWEDLPRSSYQEYAIVAKGPGRPVLGTVKWSQWHDCYEVRAEVGTYWSAECLTDLAAFLTSLSQVEPSK